MFAYGFERLEVWNLARAFFKDAYTLIDKFPFFEKNNLVDQIRRATTSIVLNLAEMTSRSSLKEQAHFAEIAFGSTIEVYCSFLLAFDLRYINEQQFNEIQLKIKEISNKINALKKSQYERHQQLKRQTDSPKQINK